ncbi:hypothetical protein [Cryptosporangium aurantiacum]|uniref:HD domain-containing protein n=1 Tax=Cryptosporangium aurantiacum TaxID=134849 RepID=A0A1M7RDW9_9ACTN|nr:hypothetical protein [Cryptosporangium aurantiacum]SHN44424.1 uncharacterized protein SAMN05443668_110205 [Cryptosporangium aurantiacum]
MIDPTTVPNVRREVCNLYDRRNHDVPFHGWHHIEFVTSKARDFALELGADATLVEVAALVHDLNYLVDTTTSAASGRDLRQKILEASGASSPEITTIEQIILDAETPTRDGHISVEAKALSDADTLFKALPITPIVLAPLYMSETRRGLRALAEKIVKEQVPLNEDEIYFYSPSARARYGEWGDVNLKLWRCVLDSLDDPDVVKLLDVMSVDV